MPFFLNGSHAKPFGGALQVSDGVALAQRLADGLGARARQLGALAVLLAGRQPVLEDVAHFLARAFVLALLELALEVGDPAAVTGDLLLGEIVLLDDLLEPPVERLDLLDAGWRSRENSRCRLLLCCARNILEVDNA
jgi:hypothetical protein